MAKSVKPIRGDHLGSPKPQLETPWEYCKRNLKRKSTVLNFQNKHTPSKCTVAVIECICMKYAARH